MFEPAVASPDLSRRERRKLEVRNRILEAAVAMFDDRGFQETTVAAICERADVAQKTFFNHFPSKQHVLREVAAFAFEEFLGQIETARKQPGTTRERLLFLFEDIATRAEQAGPMRPELVHELIRLSHHSGSEGEQARKIHDAFAGIVRDGLAAGDLSSRHEEETLIEILMGAFYVVMLNWTNFDGYPVRKRAVAAARFLGDAISGSMKGDSR